MTRKKTRLQRLFEDYRNELAVSDTVSREEAIVAYLGLLRVTEDLEQRVRSIQTLAHLNYEGILPLVIKELASYRKKPPELIPSAFYQGLLDILLPDSAQGDELSLSQGSELVEQISVSEPDPEKIKRIIDSVPSTEEGIDMLATVATIKSLRNSIENLRTLIESQDKLKRPEREYQKILASSPWMLGSQYTELFVEEFWIDTTARVDLMLASAVGHVDVVELKRPDTKILSQGSRPNTWRASPELSDVQAQARKYLQILDENRLLIESKSPFAKQSVSRLYRSGVIVVAGRTPKERGALNMLRDINVSEHRIMIFTYDDVLAIAEATIKIFERKLQRSPLLLAEKVEA